MQPPNDSAPLNSPPLVDLSFPHEWEATVLERRPLISPSRHFVYPRDVEEIERGALEMIVRPAVGRDFMATFALGFADPAVPTGVWSCPDPQQLCAIAGGYAYLVKATDPRDWEQVEYRPVLAIMPLVPQQLLLFSGHQSLVAYGPRGKAWETARLSWEGFQILEVREESIVGLGWDLMTDREFEFEVDLRDGKHQRRL